MQKQIPTAEYQLLFLKKIRRLLDEGQFSSTYKYALLIALADLSVEFGEDSSDTLELSIRDIAKKFIEQYWTHSRPYRGNTIYQNNGKQAAIIHTTNFSFLNLDSSIVTDVANTVKKMPLWKLQKIHGETDLFLYKKSDDESCITLLPGVMFCLRKFHGIIVSMVRGEWVLCVRSFKNNIGILGYDQLQEFLFGSERASLKSYTKLFEDIQRGYCFYCGKGIRSNPEVDHFIPWSRYPHDLGHNFVLAHKSCNGSKSNMLASVEHLEKWSERNVQNDEQMQDYFEQNDLHHDLKSSVAVAKWAYTQAVDTRSHLWVESKEVVLADSKWESILH